MRFAKGHGTGNDFVVIPDPRAELALDAATVARICDRRTGVGADGVLRVVPTSAVAEHAHVAEHAPWFMDYRNADGSVVETCGNGIRVFARYLLDAGYADGDELRVATRSGVKDVFRVGEGFRVDMGPAKVDPADTLRVALDDTSYDVTCVSVGNPHAVAIVEQARGDVLPRLAARLQRDPLFPEGVNVELATVRSSTAVDMRVWERGVGETLSCGSGACAAVVATATRGDTGRHVVVAVPGGELGVEWQEDGRVLLTGPVVLVADGTLRDEWLEGRA